MDQVRFRVSSGALIVSDPCYTDVVEYLPQNFVGILSPALNGEWLAEVEYYLDPEEAQRVDQHLRLVRAHDSGLPDGPYKGRVSQLIVRHSSVELLKSWKLAPFHVGVDAGVAGVFDFSEYMDAHTDEAFEEWYNRCVIDRCGNDLVATKVLHGSPFGAYSSSGWGDGAYNCFYQCIPKGAVSAVRIRYI